MLPGAGDNGRFTLPSRLRRFEWHETCPENIAVERHQECEPRRIPGIRHPDLHDLAIGWNYERRRQRLPADSFKG
jgi:hypothetical protein